MVKMASALTSKAMNSDVDECSGLSGSRERIFSNDDSQQSQPSSTQHFPILTSDSGLYACSSNTSDCSLQLEFDTYSHHQRSCLKDERLQQALQDVGKLRRELERLTKSEQWYKQELRQQKSTRLNDLERIYSQEKKFMQENQRLQKECVRLYEKCNELEKELEKQNQENLEYPIHHINAGNISEEKTFELEKEQQLALIKEQQQLISILRKQKRSLLDDIRSLTEEKDEKVTELQRLLADLEFENKLITKRYTKFAKEHRNLENNLRKSDNNLSMALQEKLNLQKSINDLKEQLDIQQQLLKFKENEVENMQQYYTQKIHHEQDMDQVHKLSVKYQEEVNDKTLQIINLKERLQEMQDEIDDMQNLQEQNELQHREIDQLNFAIEAYRLELQEMKASRDQKNKHLDELQTAMDQLIKDKELVSKAAVEQLHDFLKIKQILKSTQEQHEQLQELHKKTQFKIELLEMEKGKAKFQHEQDCQEITDLRDKLKEYLQQTTILSNKIQCLENELVRSLKENSELKEQSEKINLFLKGSKGNLELENHNHNSHEELKQHRPDLKHGDMSLHDDHDFLELQQQCEKLQENLDFIRHNQSHLKNEKVLDNLNDIVVSREPNRPESLKEDFDLLNVFFLENKKLPDKMDALNECHQENQSLLSHINRTLGSNSGTENLVKENDILKEKLCAIEAEALALQIKQDIDEGSQSYALMKDNLENHRVKVIKLQENLLKNDSRLYKMEKKLKIYETVDEHLDDLKKENSKLKGQLKEEQASRNELNRKLLYETDKLENLKQSLEELKTDQPSTKINRGIQCLLEENSLGDCDIKALKERVLELQEQQQFFLQNESDRKAERLQFLRQMMDLQNDKVETLQKNQKEWEDVLISLNNAHVLEENTRKELELKCMELEELNQVFAEQNEELRKLEEFTGLLELKRQEEKEQLQLTFQQELNVMRQNLQDCQQEIEKQKFINQQLEKRNERFQVHINEDYAADVAGYKNEVRQLKSRLSRIMEEKEDMLENLKDAKEQNKNLIDNKREAILLPNFILAKGMDSSAKNLIENTKELQQDITEDHLRILTKVLEAEYKRKMFRYDEHIHSLLSNVKILKKSLKLNEEKTALLSEEQMKAKEELKDLQKTKISLKDMQLKYEESQNIIKELKHSLDFERKKFDLTDLGKSSKSTTYEVSNLIDDYKKLIQQSAVITKRPSTSAILDLIERSNQCVPNLGKLEYNIEGLRSELQNFLISYNHNRPSTTLINTASLSVPPSLMDELRAASEGF